MVGITTMPSPLPEEKNRFSDAIKTLAVEKDLNHIEAILLFCEDTGTEIEVAISLINSNLKDTLESEGKVLHLLKSKK